MVLFRKWILSLAGMALVVYIAGAAFIDVMDIDSSHYAEMSREMNETGHYLVIKNRSVDDYLDKPPLIFWLASLAYSILGVSIFSFRLPAILATLLGAYSVYRFTKIYYDKETGLIAMLIMMTGQVYFLYNHNFLTDTLLANLTIFSIWQLSGYLEEKRWIYFLGAFTGLALAMMSKGPLGLMVPVIGLSLHFIFKGQWRNFIRWEWLAGLVLILILLSPMMWGLYKQFGSIGLQFFFWTQSFGRITGQSHWHDQSSSFYFVHTFIWFMFPWSILAIYGLIKNLGLIFSKKKWDRLPEIVTTGGFILSFFVLSLSKYKLPQYIFVLIPLAATFTASAAMDLIRHPVPSRMKNWITGSGFGISVLYWALATGLLVFTFPDKFFLPWTLLIFGFLLFLFLAIHPMMKKYRLILPIAATAIFVNLLLNLHFYPNLLYYQTGKRIAEAWKKTGYKGDKKLFYLHYHSPALDFHLGSTPPVINQRKLLRMAEKSDETWVVTNQAGRNRIAERFIIKEIAFDRYPVQALTINFLDKNKRKEKLSKDYLIMVKKE